MDRPQVIDFFCGAGGFSEGFRQQGFDVVMGIDSWSFAIDTHNLNHRLNDKPRDLLAIGSSLAEIIKLPDTAVILGSPPCVSFSHSNKGGNGDKTEGMKLIKSFLRIVAVKKHHPGSKLVAWFMENVPNAKRYIKDTYTFSQLSLTKWAKKHCLDPKSVALRVGQNAQILNAADFGAPQIRKRLFCGEIISFGTFPDLEPFKVSVHRCLGEIKRKMPKPHRKLCESTLVDPNYKTFRIRACDLTDHFYDSGIYYRHWNDARWLKLNHPYMGPMSFPENEKKPSRTVLATQSENSREALIYKSEHHRKGDGEYRLPTIREVATLMGFPYSYQFTGSEAIKWRLIGNAVSPHLSAALAKSVRVSMKLRLIPDSQVPFESLNGESSRVENLNTFRKRTFDDPPQKHPKARFRRHPFKQGGMTVALTNFNPTVSNGNLNARDIEWFCVAFFGTGRDFRLRIVPEASFHRIGKMLEIQLGLQARNFLKGFENKFRKIIGKSGVFQAAYTGDRLDSEFDPRNIIDRIQHFVLEHDPKDKLVSLADILPEKKTVPTSQAFALYAINRIIS